ncbi:hypothetical protein J6590_074692 [Homalodisca vitripennis]|nr:hypothetical protein J6590_074692 [Homalodisca vitripennis]
MKVTCKANEEIFADAQARLLDRSKECKELALLSVTNISLSKSRNSYSYERLVRFLTKHRRTACKDRITQRSTIQAAATLDVA